MDYRQLIAEHGVKKQLLNNQLCSEKIEFLKEQRRALNEFTKKQDDQREALRMELEEQKLLWLNERKLSKSSPIIAKQCDSKSKIAVLKIDKQPLIEKYTTNRLIQPIKEEKIVKTTKKYKLDDRQMELFSRIQMKKRKIENQAMSSNLPKSSQSLEFVEENSFNNDIPDSQYFEKQNEQITILSSGSESEKENDDTYPLDNILTQKDSKEIEQSFEQSESQTTDQN